MSSKVNITTALNDLTDRLIAYRFVRRIEMESRLADKLKRAGGIVARQSAKIEERLDKLLAKEPLLEKQTDEAFSAHEAMISDIEKGVDRFAHDLAPITNGSPFQDGTKPEESEEKPDHPPYRYAQ